MNRRKRLKEPAPANGARIRVPVNADPPPDQTYPLFSLQFLASGTYGLSTCTQEEKAAFADRLWRLSQVSWLQLQHADRHGLGSEKIPREAIQVGIPPHVTPDVTFFLAFRFHGNAPMVGYRSRTVFYILWLDRAFTLYRH